MRRARIPRRHSASQHRRRDPGGRGARPRGLRSTTSRPNTSTTPPNSTCPPRSTTTMSDAVRELAIRAFKAIDGQGLARVDFFLTDDGPLINEVNTMPGFTTISMYPRMWAASGVDYPTLLATMVERRWRAGRVCVKSDAADPGSIGTRGHGAVDQLGELLDRRRSRARRQRQRHIDRPVDRVPGGPHPISGGPRTTAPGRQPGSAEPTTKSAGRSRPQRSTTGSLAPAGSPGGGAWQGRLRDRARAGSRRAAAAAPPAASGTRDPARAAPGQR